MGSDVNRRYTGERNTVSTRKWLSFDTSFVIVVGGCCWWLWLTAQSREVRGFMRTDRQRANHAVFHHRARVFPQTYLYGGCA